MSIKVEGDKVVDLENTLSATRLKEIDQSLKKEKQQQDLFKHFIRNNMLIIKKPLSEITNLEDSIANIGVKKMNKDEEPEFDIRINCTEVGKLYHILSMLELILDKPEKISPEDKAWIPELGLRLVRDWRETLDKKLKAR